MLYYTCTNAQATQHTHTDTHGIKIDANGGALAATVLGRTNNCADTSTCTDTQLPLPTPSTDNRMVFGLFTLDCVFSTTRYHTSHMYTCICCTIRTRLHMCMVCFGINLNILNHSLLVRFACDTTWTRDTWSNYTPAPVFTNYTAHTTHISI